MSNLQVLDIMYQAFQLALRLSMTFVPKLLAILAMMGILGSSMLVMLQDFTRQVCAMIAGG